MKHSDCSRTIVVLKDFFMDRVGATVGRWPSILPRTDRGHQPPVLDAALGVGRVAFLRARDVDEGPLPRSHGRRASASLTGVVVPAQTSSLIGWDAAGTTSSASAFYGAGLVVESVDGARWKNVSVGLGLGEVRGRRS